MTINSEWVKQPPSPRNSYLGRTVPGIVLFFGGGVFALDQMINIRPRLHQTVLSAIQAEITTELLLALSIAGTWTWTRFKYPNHSGGQEKFRPYPVTQRGTRIRFGVAFATTAINMYWLRFVLLDSVLQRVDAGAAFRGYFALAALSLVIGTVLLGSTMRAIRTQDFRFPAPPQQS